MTAKKMSSKWWLAEYHGPGSESAIVRWMDRHQALTLALALAALAGAWALLYYNAEVCDWLAVHFVKWFGLKGKVAL